MSAVSQAKAPTRISVAIATRGRAELLSRTVARLERQSLTPDEILIVCTRESDVERAALERLPHCRVLIGVEGLAAQRNLALDNLSPDCDVIAFFDDDFVADDNWLAAVADVFAGDPQAACVTGEVIADGIKGPGIALDDAIARIAAHRPPARPRHIEGYSPYGCNMAYRRAALGDLRFDERLVLYGWQEDRDFGARVARNGGRQIKTSAAFGVHLGTKSGRGSGLRLGYSQIVNPFYLMRKGSMSGADALQHVLCNLASNALLSVAPEAYVDRRGRLTGNLRGLRDLALGRASPERARQL